MPLSALLLALVTLFLWSFLAYLGSLLTSVPPFLLVGIALTTSGFLGAFRWRDWGVPLKTLAVGVGGIFGYHFLYFTAFQHAPPVETSLVNYLWPLLIVVLSPVFLPGYRLRPHHLLGTMLGLLGAGLIATRGRLSLDWENLDGYLLAGGAALTWASYSLMTKRLTPFPTGAVGAFCLVSGVLSLGFFLTSSSAPLASIANLDGREWLLLVILGIGPMGLAFFTWDAALKRGDPRVIGALAYLAPLLSTLNLVLWGGLKFTLVAAIAMLFIVSGAVIGSLELFKKTGAARAPQSRTLPHN